MHFVKGIPESILSECMAYTGPDGAPLTITDESKDKVLSHSQRMASPGLRILAMAYGLTLDQLTFAGVLGVGTEDPPRPRYDGDRRFEGNVMTTFSGTDLGTRIFVQSVQYCPKINQSNKQWSPTARLSFCTVLATIVIGL